MLFLSSIIVVSCNPEKKTSSETVRNLNPSEEPLQETPIYKHVEIIKLETSPVSLISNVNRIEMNDSIIFVSEFGKLINYDFYGKYLSTVSVPAGSFQSCHYTFLTEDNQLLSHNMMDMNDTEAYSLFDMRKQRVKQYFSYQPITVGNYMYPFSWHPMARSGKDIDIIMPLCDTIYTYSAATSSFEPKYIIETPQKMIPKEKIRKNTPSYTEDICKLSEQGFFTGFTGIFETEAKILLEYKDQGVVMGYFLFDKSSKAGHYYLTTWNEKYTTLPFFNTIYAYKNVFVGYAQPRDLLELENLQDEKIRESIKDLEEDDNPCLILYELK